MNIEFGHGLFLDAQGEIIGVGTLTESCEEMKAIYEKMKALIEKMKALFEKMKGQADEINPQDALEALIENRKNWKEAAYLSEEQAAAMMKAIEGELADQAARQAMKRRKLMHADSSFPDGMRCCATCRHHAPIGAEIRSACCGCIIGGDCTKWEPAGGDTDDS